MSSASTILDCIAPQFASDAKKSEFIEFATSRTNSCLFGNQTQMAIALRAAHMMTLRDRAGDSGVISSKREGDLAISYKVADTADSDNDLPLTSYGKQLIGLRRGLSAAVAISGGATNSNGASCGFGIC